eukprot:3062084-Rhodomonas_salina.1
MSLGVAIRNTEYATRRPVCPPQYAAFSAAYANTHRIRRRKRGGGRDTHGDDLVSAAVHRRGVECGVEALGLPASERACVSGR